jgi:hypothetical protein
MAAWIDKEPNGNRDYSLSYVGYVWNDMDYFPIRVTAFPILIVVGRGCAYCGDEINYDGPLIDVKLLVGKYNAYLCPPCFKQDRRLCPVTMGCKDICIQRNSALLKESSLCILRCTHLSPDLRRLLYDWIKKTCTCLHQ